MKTQDVIIVTQFGIYTNQENLEVNENMELIRVLPELGKQNSAEIIWEITEQEQELLDEIRRLDKEMEVKEEC